MNAEFLEGDVRVDAWAGQSRGKPSGGLQLKPVEHGVMIRSAGAKAVDAQQAEIVRHKGMVQRPGEERVLRAI